MANKKVSTKSKPRTTAKAKQAAIAEQYKKFVERLSFNAASTTEAASRMWAGSLETAYSPNQEINPAVRERIRTRARHETNNNSYFTGIVDTLTEDVLGFMPKLVIANLSSSEQNLIRSLWDIWADAVNLRSLLRTSIKAWIVDGESFILLDTRANLDSPIQLFPRLIEPEQVTSPASTIDDHVDGIEVDTQGVPIAYYVLRNHPSSGVYLDAQRVDADKMLHLFLPHRPNALRGISQLSPCLHLGALLRSFTMATLCAARAAAIPAGVLTTGESNPLVGEDESAGLEITVGEGSFLVLPPMANLNQLKAEHPNSTYKDFKRELVSEIARALSVPYIVAAGDSTDTSYAGGRLDFETYNKKISALRYTLINSVLDKLFAAFSAEASLQNLMPEIDDDSVSWLFDGVISIDPQKDANAAETLIKNNLLTYDEYFKQRNKDWESQFAQIAKEQAVLRSLAPQEKPVDETDDSETDNSETPDSPDEAGDEGVEDKEETE